MKRLLAVVAFLAALALAPSAFADTPLYKLYDLGPGVSIARISPNGTQVAYTAGSDSYLWNNGTPIDLGSFQAFGVDDAGDVVGTQTVNGSSVAVEWSNNVLQPLPSIAGSTETTAAGINDTGQVAGMAEIAGGWHPVRWEPDGGGGADLLDTLACDPGYWGSGSVHGITESGLVYGQEAIPPLGDTCFDGYNDPAVTWVGGGSVTQLTGTDSGVAVGARPDGTIYLYESGNNSFSSFGGALTALTGLDSAGAQVVGGDDAGDAIGVTGTGGVIQLADGREATLASVSTYGNDFRYPMQVGSNGDVVGYGTSLTTNNHAEGFLLHRVTSLGFSITSEQPSYTIPGAGYATIVYDVHVANHGPDAATATSVTFADNPTSVFSYVGSTASCSGSALQLTCSLGTLAAGASTDFTITVRAVAAGHTGTFGFAATAYLQATTADAGTVSDRESSSPTLTVASDTTPPTITFVGPLPTGWQDTPVTLTWTCADAGSGPTSPSVQQVISSEGTNEQATGTCTDGAGNTASDTEGGVDIDLTPPSVTATPSRQPDHGGWYTSPFSVTWSGSDALSGLAGCAAPTTVTADAANGSVSGDCTDIAGNIGTGEFDYALDQTPPTLTVGDETLAAGDATLTTYSSLTASDDQSTPDVACTPSLPHTFATGTTQVSCTATDAAGNDTTRTFTVVVEAPSATPPPPSAPPSTATTTTTVTTTTTTPTTTTSAPGTESVAPDEPGELSTQQVTVKWPAGAIGESAEIAVQKPAVATAPSLTAPTGVVEVTVTAADGSELHEFPLPLEVDFADAPVGFAPSTSTDGMHWRAIPELAALPLPASQPDGYVRDGATVRVFTHHLSLFGLAAVVAPTVSGTARLHKRVLEIRITVRRPAHVTILLERNGHTVHSWLRDVSGTRTVALRVSGSTAGRLRVRLHARAAGLFSTATLTVHT
ncbi:MAG: hypothetical protein ABUS54_15210 [Actinomycetota bacterium]